MKQKEKPLRNLELFKFSSTKRNLMIYLPDFVFRHEDEFDRFVGRDAQFRRLFRWLVSTTESESYLITGYRGMGKSLLVKRVIQAITRKTKAYKEFIFNLAVICIFIACLTRFEDFGCSCFSLSAAAFAIFLILLLHLSKIINDVKFYNRIIRVPHHLRFDKEMINKFFFFKKDRRYRKHNRIEIQINLGQEVLGEHDVLSLLASNIKESYTKFVKSRQHRPFLSFFVATVIVFIGCASAKWVVIPVLNFVGRGILNGWYINLTGFWSIIISILDMLRTVSNSTDFLTKSIFYIVFYTFSCWVIHKLLKHITLYVPCISAPHVALRRINDLTDRINATTHEEKGINSQPNNGLFSISIFNQKVNKVRPMAGVREIEHELTNIINDVSGKNCPPPYRAQFILVFDELDKISKTTDKPVRSESQSPDTPEYETSVDGFTDAMAYEERKNKVLSLLANMKMFLTSVHAKCVFISGHELFDASMADLSDREFALSSIFNGVMNVNSFLSPERGQTDVSSMTEVYLATMLLPGDFLVNRMKQNAEQGVLKEEYPSLKWYNEYLMNVHIPSQENPLTQDEWDIEDTVRFTIEFLRYFTVFLAHISNGSPKKISSYFEKYVKLYYDVKQQRDWGDTIVVGEAAKRNKAKQYALYFNATDQKLINFISYIAMPVMNAITNEVSDYGDKLLVSSSFILDQIYKYHGRGFSWRNLELMPELLNSNKNPELRDSMASIIEFLLQVHITNITSGIYQYKFHKQISEEISALSKISEEASAIFNFTLNESETVKRYNTKLLNHYLNLSQRTSDKSRYDNVIEVIHENLGDLYFSEEDFYRAVQEYKCVLSYIEHSGTVIGPQNILQYLKCGLKMGLSYESRRTYADAYLMYCNIINRLSEIRKIQLGDFGLDFTMRMTDDWRSKQLVYTYTPDKEKKNNFDTQFHPGLWDADKKNDNFKKPCFSIDSDKSVSAFSQLYTAEKSKLFFNLTAFEDVKFIYQTILAKLFVIEKMEVSGITQSSIDQAESEFAALHGATNTDEKFMVAADFFGKMSRILYYKNNFVFASPVESLSAVLYISDVNVWSLMDDYCFSICRDHENDAIQVKDNINKFFNQLEFKSVTFNESFTFEGLYKFFKDKTPQIITENELFESHVTGYLKYLDTYLKPKVDSRILLISCPKRQNMAKQSGYRLPCNACKYANRSLKILMKHMFVKEPDINSGRSKALLLLENTVHRKLRYIRPNQVVLLAEAAARRADIMLSCSYFDKDRNLENKELEPCDFTTEALELLSFLSQNIIDEKARLDRIRTLNTRLSKLDRVVLYYWAAYRYYEMSAKYKEAVDCLNRIAKVFEDFLKALNFYRTYCSKEITDNNFIFENADTIIRILNNLFSCASRVTGTQYDYLNMAEIHEYKWLFHLDYADDIDLTKLTVFPDLQSLFLTIVNSKLLLYRNKRNQDEYDEYLIKIYPRISQPLKHEMTFKGEVESNYMKAYINRLVLFNLLNNNEILINRCMMAKPGSNKRYTSPIVFKRVYTFLSTDKVPSCLKGIFGMFKIDGSFKSRIDLLEFLIHDSMVSLSYVLKTLTPHNHFTTFPNSYIAEVYDLLWEWSKYYELIYNIYAYYRFCKENDVEAQTALLKMMIRNIDMDANKGQTFDQKIDELKELLQKIIKLMEDNGLSCDDEYGYLYNKLFANVRHEMDDSTIHHIYTNYSVGMAVKYYTNARSVNSEGIEYKNMITGMYILDDDIQNDTCQYNLADERYLLNSGVWSEKRKWFLKMYGASNFGNIEEGYEIIRDTVHNKMSLSNRFKDSNYANSPY